MLTRNLARYIEVSKFPPIRRDLAIVVDENVDVASILKTINDGNIEHYSHAALFDIYRGKGIAENKKSLAFLVLMQDTQKTLTDSEADAVMAKILDLVMHQHGAILR